MWVFAYGSLISDGWEKRHGCLFRCAATLSGYSRKLDKASSVSRGSHEHPAPTLRIVASDQVCHGVAFEFSADARQSVMSYLQEREGKAFPFREKPIRLADGREVAALVPIYEGKQLISATHVGDVALMCISARGKRGDGVGYVRDIARHLDEAGIEDTAITAVRVEIERILQARRTPKDG
jgi:cation transport regulator ChaC